MASLLCLIAAQCVLAKGVRTVSAWSTEPKVLARYLICFTPSSPTVPAPFAWTLLESVSLLGFFVCQLGDFSKESKYRWREKGGREVTLQRNQAPIILDLLACFVVNDKKKPEGDVPRTVWNVVFLISDQRKNVHF